MILKLCSFIRTAQRAGKFIEKLCMSTVIEVAHHQIAFPNQPVPQVDTTQKQFVTLLIYNFITLSADKIRMGHMRATQRDNRTAGGVLYKFLQFAGESRCQ